MMDPGGALGGGGRVALVVVMVVMVGGGVHCCFCLQENLQKQTGLSGGGSKRSAHAGLEADGAVTAVLHLGQTGRAPPSLALKGFKELLRPPPLTPMGTQRRFLWQRP